MYFAVMVGKTVEQDVREGYPSTMTDSVLARGREVLYKWYHTGELVEASILGPSTQGDDFVRLKYAGNGRDYENPSAPLSAAPFALTFTDVINVIGGDPTTRTSRSPRLPTKPPPPPSAWLGGMSHP